MRPDRRGLWARWSVGGGEATRQMARARRCQGGSARRVGRLDRRGAEGRLTGADVCLFAALCLGEMCLPSRDGPAENMPAVSGPLSD